MRKKTNYIIKALSGLFITVLLLIILLPKTSLNDILVSASSFSLGVIAAAFASYICLYLFRALRFRILLGNSLGMKDMFSIVCLHNLFNQIIPARLGEFSYIYMVRQRGIPLHKNISSIAIARLFDMCIISALFFIGLATTPLLIDRFYFILVASIAIAVIIIIFMFFASTRPEMFIKLIGKVSSWFRIKSVRSVLSRIGEVFNEFRMLRSKKTLLQIIFSSLLVWLSAYLSMFFLLNSIFPNLNLENVFLIASIPIFISILPVYGFAGIGTIEVGFTFPLLIFAVSLNDAVAASFAVHIIQLIFTLVLAAAGYASLAIMGYKKA